MSDVKGSAENVLDSLEGIVETQKDLIVIKFLQRFSTSASFAVIGIFCLMVLLTILIFTGIGFSLWIGERLMDMKAGFLIVAGIYSVVLLIIILSAKRILLPVIRDLIIDKMYDED